MLRDELLRTPCASESHFASDTPLKRNESGAASDVGCDERRDSVSPARLWPTGGSPALPQLLAAHSPMLRFALTSPDAHFEATDYINRLLSDDPLLRSPVGDENNLIVDTNGELVLPVGVAAISTTCSKALGTNVQAERKADAERYCQEGVENDAETARRLLQEEVRRDHLFEFILSEVAGPEKQVKEPGAKESQTLLPSSPAASGSISARQISSIGRDNGIGKTGKKKSSNRKRAVAVASAAASAASAANSFQRPTLTTAFLREGKTLNSQGKRTPIRQTDQATLKKLAISTGNKRFRSGIGFRKNDTERGSLALSSQYTEEELKRIRRVKNRASVEKCRTKQRKRMESLEIELQALQQENNNLLAVTKCVLSTFDAISREVLAITGTHPTLTI